jgi:hypothetical protein
MAVAGFPFVSRKKFLTGVAMAAAGNFARA